MDSIMTKDYLKVTLPIAVLSGLWGLNTALQTVILGHMTSAAIAANSAASNLFLMVKSTAVGAASATGIMIGKTLAREIWKEPEFTPKGCRNYLLSLG